MVATAYLLILLWGGAHAPHTPAGALLTGTLLAAGMIVLRRQTIREFPDADLHELGGRARALRDRALQSARATHAARLERRPARSGSPVDEILRLRDLRDTGLLTDNEFELGKTLVLSGK